MIFRGRDERFAEEIATELEPYQSIVIDYEAEERLRSLDMDVMMAGRHLLTSNDRYQVSAAHLSLARNQYLLANTITSELTRPANGDYRPQGFDNHGVVDFLRQTYQSARQHLETADLVASRKGYQADEEHLAPLHSLGARRWPLVRAVSSRFVQGAVEASDKIMGYVGSQQDAIQASSVLAPSHKRHLEGRMHPLLVDTAARRKSVEQVVNAGLLRSSPEAVMAEVYEDTTVAIGGLNRLSVWLTYPQAYDSSLRVRQPLEEARPGEHKFDPSILGPTPAVPSPRRVAPWQAPRPFDPNVLGQPPTTPRPPAERPFDPQVLVPAPSVPPSRLEERPFDPSVLDCPKRNERPFDPSILDRPKESPEE
ncbi:MAG TPA: hypothetical protein VFT16_00255 [Candidatus Saccharimonadales bacterium]|nr:hypothetical protein [Candidatus Saccharimonadales bacterium]